MTPQEFLVIYAAEVATDPEANPHLDSGAIRLNKDCPITYVVRRRTGYSFTTGDYRRAGQEIGLERPEAGLIAHGADHAINCDGQAPLWRAALMVASGLTPAPTEPTPKSMLVVV